MDASTNDSEARREILEWISGNDVAKQIEPIGFPKTLGSSEGCLDDVRIDFTEEGLDNFTGVRFRRK